MGEIREGRKEATNTPSLCSNSCCCRALLGKEGIVYGCLQMRFEESCSRDEAVACHAQTELAFALSPLREFFLLAANLSPTTDRDQLQHISHAADREPVVSRQAVVDRCLHFVVGIEHDGRHSLSIWRHSHRKEPRRVEFIQLSQSCPVMVRRANCDVIWQRHDAAPHFLVNQVCRSRLAFLRYPKVAPDEHSAARAEIGNG